MFAYFSNLWKFFRKKKMDLGFRFVRPQILEMTLRKFWVKLLMQRNQWHQNGCSWKQIWSYKFPPVTLITHLVTKAGIKDNLSQCPINEIQISGNGNNKYFPPLNYKTQMLNPHQKCLSYSTDYCALITYSQAKQ